MNHISYLYKVIYDIYTLTCDCVSLLYFIIWGSLSRFFHWSSIWPFMANIAFSKVEKWRNTWRVVLILGTSFWYLLRVCGSWCSWITHLRVKLTVVSGLSWLGWLLESNIIVHVVIKWWDISWCILTLLIKISSYC